MTHAWVIEVELANRQAAYWTGRKHREAFHRCIAEARTYPSVAAAYERALWLLDTRPETVTRAEVRPGR